LLRTSTGAPFGDRRFLEARDRNRWLAGRYCATGSVFLLLLRRMFFTRLASSAAELLGRVVKGQAAIAPQLVLNRGRYKFLVFL
jgi:hypothetical protein